MGTWTIQVHGQRDADTSVEEYRFTGRYRCAEASACGQTDTDRSGYGFISRKGSLDCEGWRAAGGQEQAAGWGKG